MGKCAICHKPTTSHAIGSASICHTCWIEKQEEVEKIKRILQAHEWLPELGHNIKTEGEIFNWFHEYNSILDEVWEIEGYGDTHHKTFWSSYEMMSRTLWEFAEVHGWPFIEKLISKFNPITSSMSDYSPIENVVSRMVITSRFDFGVNSIPVGALRFLSLFHNSEGDFEWEESFVFGWGFDHDELNFAEILEESIKEGTAIWASGALENAIFADQTKASEILIEFLKRKKMNIDRKLELLQCLTFHENKLSTRLPRFWNWIEATNFSFSWIPEVKNNIRNIIIEELPEVAEQLPNDWTFHDFEL